uniref:Cysteine and histidine-rich domain-containing protein n=1 Tax=Lygus hesperus TaxID=30085 RepID=A0A0A9W051_LYGHE
MSEKKLVLCYNRGCGQSFDPESNNDDSCRHHSGAPVFHDAYKGWSCCNKKCTDFTEFLNIKGCTVSKHSNVKPPEPEKPKIDKSLEEEVIEYRAPTAPEPKPLERPPYDTPMAKMKVSANKALMDQLAALKTSGDHNKVPETGSTTDIPIGTSCQNNSCKTVYEGAATLSTSCTYHPGYPVFHEGLKFWTCCTKRTTDFDNFLAQVGCATGDHVWSKQKVEGDEVKCRLDWYQTATHVYVSVFGKKCDPDASKVELSPIRLKLQLYFPEQNGTYQKDMELRGIVDVANSSVTMTPAKVEVSMKKKEGGSWAKLEIPREQTPGKVSTTPHVSILSDQVESVDLGDL